MGFTTTGTLGKSGGLLEPQFPHLYNGMLLLILFGFLPRLNENMEWVVIVITGIKRAISLLINVENVSAWMARTKDPMALSSLPPQSHIVGNVV